MANRLWTVTPWRQPPAAPTPWTTFQVAHTAHSLDDEVVLFSIVKRASFRLSRFRRNGPSGPVFYCQVGLFWIDKNKMPHDGVPQVPSPLAHLPCDVC
jgi:hypothetical protein